MDEEDKNKLISNVIHGDWINKRLSVVAYVRETRGIITIDKYNGPKWRRNKTNKMETKHDKKQRLWLLDEIMNENDIKISSIELRECNPETDVVYNNLCGVNEFWQNGKFLLCTVYVNKKYIMSWITKNKPLQNNGMPAFYNERMEMCMTMDDDLKKHLNSFKKRALTQIRGTSRWYRL